VFHARIQVCYRNKKFFYQSLNIDKAVSPYQVWNKVIRGRRAEGQEATRVKRQEGTMTGET
jgi:hypothetical protein